MRQKIHCNGKNINNRRYQVLYSAELKLKRNYRYKYRSQSFSRTGTYTSIIGRNKKICVVDPKDIFSDSDLQNFISDFEINILTLN
jgi:hypothetical protein